MVRKKEAVPAEPSIRDGNGGGASTPASVSWTDPKETVNLASSIKLEEKRDRNPASERRALLRFLAYLKPYLPMAMLGTACGIVNYGIGAFTPQVAGYLIDRFLLPSSSHHAASTNVFYPKIDHLLAVIAPHATPLGKAEALVFFAMSLILVSGVLIFTRVIVINVGGQRVTFSLRNDLFEHIQSLSLSFFQLNRSGSIVSRLTSDIALAQNFVGNACAVLWMDMLSVIGYAIMLFILNRHMALISFIVLPIWVVCIKYFGGGIRQASHEVQEGMSALSGQVQEKISGATVAQAFAREKRETRLFHHTHRTLLDRQIRTVYYMAANTAASTILTGLAPLAVILYGVHQVFIGAITGGMLVTFYTSLGLLYFPLQRLTDLSAVIASATAAIERIFEVFDIKSEIQDVADPYVLPKPIKGRIEFKDVNFGYEHSPLPSEVRAAPGEGVGVRVEYTPILKSINLTINPGEVVAFVGPSGAGKSTLVNLVPRFFDVQSGAVLVDGHDVKGVKTKSLRNNIGMVLQDNILFTGTIRDNILYGRPQATEDEMVEAAVAGNAHEFIVGLANGYETEIGERGSKLSGGQKQRIAISRAFLRDPRILILDEATSALDSESERLIKTALNRLMVGRTTLIIAHRLSTIMHADKIVAMQDGRIVEVGTHAELLSHEGLYYHLYKAQFEHALEAVTDGVTLESTVDTPSKRPATGRQSPGKQRLCEA